MGQFLENIKKGWQESVIKRKNENFDDGFYEAANLCIDIIEKNIERLSHKEDLSGKEQFLLKKLLQIKKEIENELKTFFYDNDDTELNKS